MIERVYPGVYLAEVPFEAKAIDGVPTTDAPAWTEPNAHDPGVTLIDVFAFLSESLLYRIHPATHGIVSGLAVQASGSADARVQVSPGTALDCTGREITTDLSAQTSRYIGETEKNLRATLAATASAGVVLHYDESQSLFDDWP